MSSDSPEKAAPANPGEDTAFSQLVGRWSDGSLGFDKDEGIGLLWKEGLIGAFLAAFYARAPRTMAALGELLAREAPPYGEDTGYVPRRLVFEYANAMSLAPKQRNDRLDELEIGYFVAKPDLRAVFSEIEPPMPRRFRETLEGWVDLAAGIEQRANSPAPRAAARSFAVGAKVRHAQWGAGIITSLKEGPRPAAVVNFAGVGEKKVLADFLQLEGDI